MEEPLLDHEELNRRMYLPSVDGGVDATEYLKQYINQEFPHCNDGTPNIYSVPRNFKCKGERQASDAECEVFQRLHGLRSSSIPGLWVTFFHSACYAGRSFRNHRLGKLMIREHDFVLFAQYQGKHYVALLEVKSTNDHHTNIVCEKSSDAKVIKNNKRSAQHQLRDHLEMMKEMVEVDRVQSYIMWPFLGGYTRDPRDQVIKRWKEDGNLHIFADTIENQEEFNIWFRKNVLEEGTYIAEHCFVRQLNRFIILSCSVFIDEIDEGLTALLTQDQLQLLNTDTIHHNDGSAVVVHGAAGTGKTLLVLRKLQQLHRAGRLNAHNRALYICYWPGIRRDLELKLESLGLRPYVDTTRFFISISEFLLEKHSYRHIFMDEAEALCLSFSFDIVQRTLCAIYQQYHRANCCAPRCSMDPFEEARSHQVDDGWGALWFLVDINQASFFLPKHSPIMLKKPNIILSKVMRSSGCIFNVFKQFYNVPMPLLPKELLANTSIPSITLGHQVCGPPVYWTEATDYIDKVVAELVMDLCSTKGFQPKDLCVLPFLVNDKLVPQSVNKYIDESFVANSYRPEGISDVEHYLNVGEINHFLIVWALRVKGLEFKVVIMAIDDDDFEHTDSEDRKRAYIMSSRCTSMLIVVSNQIIRDAIDLEGNFEKYPFHMNFN